MHLDDHLRQIGRIVSIGDLKGLRATRVIDARGRIVAPGFIDIHSHADDGASARGGLRDADARRRAAPNLVTQGITTVVVNHDGRSPLPIRDQRAFLEKNGIGPNAMLMVGHGTVRREVMGTDFRRAATPAEIQRMRALVRQAMQEGAVGLSAGLEYVPGRWSTTDEVVALAGQRRTPASTARFRERSVATRSSAVSSRSKTRCDR